MINADYYYQYCRSTWTGRTVRYVNPQIWSDRYNSASSTTYLAEDAYHPSENDDFLDAAEEVNAALKKNLTGSE